MKIDFPPNSPAEVAQRSNARPFEPFPQTLPVLTYVTMLWCCVVHFMVIGVQEQGFDAVYAIQEKYGAMGADPWSEPLWKYITTCFIHDPRSLLHIIFNMMWLHQLGPLMERGIGTANSLVFILVTGFVSSSFGVSLEGVGIGYSGVVFAMAGFMWTAWPRWTGFIENFNGRTVQFIVFWQLICLVLTMSNAMNIGNASHISGMVIGALIGQWAKHGNHTTKGKLWLAITIAVTLTAVLFAFWSPWVEGYHPRTSLV